MSDIGACVGAGARGTRPDTPQLPPTHSSYMYTVQSRTFTHGPAASSYFTWLLSCQKNLTVFVITTYSIYELYFYLFHCQFTFCTSFDDMAVILHI